MPQAAEPSSHNTEKAHKPSPEKIEETFVSFQRIYKECFLTSLSSECKKYLILSTDKLHCAAKAYMDDLYRYEDYAESPCADRHKQAGYRMKWISRFQPIQLNTEKIDDGDIKDTLLDVNESFAFFAGLARLDNIERAPDFISDEFYDHMIYTLRYRNVTGKGLSTIMYLIEQATINGGKIGKKKEKSLIKNIKEIFK